MSQLVIDGIVTNYYMPPRKDDACWLIILPGWKRTSKEWVICADRLAEKNNVVVLDFPGFGLTPEPPEAFDTYDYANFVNKVLQKLGIAKCKILGHSFGGRVGIVMATEDSHNIEQLILVDPGGLDKPTLKIQLIKSLLLLTRPAKVFLGSLVPVLAKRVGSSDYLNAGNMRKTLVRVVNQNLRQVLGKVTTPLAVIWGDKDEVVSVKTTQFIKCLLPKTKIRIVWGSGHCPHIEKPAKFLEILEEIL